MSTTASLKMTESGKKGSKGEVDDDDDDVCDLQHLVRAVHFLSTRNTFSVRFFVVQTVAVDELKSSVFKSIDDTSSQPSKGLHNRPAKLSPLTMWSNPDPIHYMHQYIPIPIALYTFTKAYKFPISINRSTYT